MPLTTSEQGPLARRLLRMCLDAFVLAAFLTAFLRLAVAGATTLMPGEF